MRTFSKLASLGLLAGALSTGQAQAQLVVSLGAGDWREANIKAYVEPFEKETGIKVARFQGDAGMAQLRLQHETNSVEMDVWIVSTSVLKIGTEKGWLDKIDYSIFKPNELAKIYEASKKPNGVGALYYSIVMSYNADTIKGTAPSGWAQFWDVEKFPGRRTLYGGALAGGIWEIALMADGVTPDKLYPLDVDRAVKSLNKIKKHVTSWWRNGADNQQLFADKVVDMGPAYDGRIGNLQKQGMNLKMDWNGGILYQDFWAVAAGSKRKAEAMKFIEFATRADRQADFSSRISYGPTNAGAYDILDKTLGEKLASHPENIKKQFAINEDYYSQIDASGKSNLQKMNELWARWSVE